MGHYKSNVRDLEFNLFEVLKIQERLGKGVLAESDEDTARGVLAELNRLATGPLASPSLRRTATRRRMTPRPSPRRCPSPSRRPTT